MKQTLPAIPLSGIYRGAMTDGSRGFQPTVMIGAFSFRRGATVDPVALRGVTPGFMSRAATRFVVVAGIRGLKPTATVMKSLRDEDAMPGRGAAIDGSRAFQRPVPGPLHVLRRIAKFDVYGLRNKSRY